MEAESLNIKLKLDLSSVTSGVTKVKKQLTGMAKSVKDSIPHISKEGNKASKSLNDVSTASNKAKKAIGDIGKEAKSSLGNVSRESSKVVNSLKSIKANSNISFGYDSENISESTETVNNALDSVKSRITALLGVDIFKGITGNWEKISGFFKKITEEGWYAPLFRLKEILKDVGKTIGGAFTGNIEKARQGISHLKYDTKLFVQDIKGVITNLTKEFKILAVVGTGAVAAVLAIAGASIANNTKEFREEQTKLNSAFVAAGASAKEASQAYNGLFRFLGKSDVAVEAANHLAKMTTNTKALAEWTTIAQGIYATFGDSLPIEGLTEAANESIRVGKVTGVLADALNWAGVSEDDFNAALAQTNSLAEREVLLRSTLNGLYQNAAQIYEQNNRRIIEQNEAQARLNATMARIGQQTQVLATSWVNLKSTVMNVLAPAIIYISAVFSVLIDKIASAIKWLDSLFGIKFDSIGTSISGISAGVSNITSGANGLANSLDGANSAAQKLKRTTMGFDELNVIPKPDTSSGGAGASAGGGGGLTGLDTGNGVISKMGEQIEDVKTKVEAFFDKWKWQITTIGIALGALSIAKLLTGLGRALGLGNKFLATMNKIKKLAAGVITIVLQYTLVNKFLDSFIDGEGFIEYLKAALVSALGTGLLYAMWGPAGLVFGLGVTAVASITSVIDNGGIDSTESAIVALTGLASAIGAIGVAFKKLNLGTILPAIGTAIKTHMTKIGIVISGALSSISGVVSTVLSGIKIAVSAATSFIMANPIVLIIAAIVALVALIATKGDEIQNILNKVSNWLKKTFCRDWRDVFGNTLGTVINGFVKIVSDIMGSVKKVLNGIIDFIRGVFTGNWERAWKGIKNIFSGVFSGLKSVAKAPINGIIALINGALSAITSGLNAVKRALNKISVDIPSWVPGFGGKKFGFNFSMSSAPKIPMLAKGGIAQSETLAHIGENGYKEAVLPLDRNTEWMDSIADRVIARMPTQKVVLQVGEKELGWATIGAINGITKQTGTLQLSFT